LEFEFVFDKFEPWSTDGVAFKQITQSINACGDFCEVILQAVHEDDDQRVPGLVLTGLSFASPLTVKGAFKYVYEETANKISWLFDAVLTRTVYYDLERQRRVIEIQSAIRDVRKKDIDNTRALLDLLREHNIDLATRDTAKLLESISTFHYPSTKLDSHRIGPALGGAAVPVDEDTKKPS
jgi:hypothetical protein